MLQLFKIRFRKPLSIRGLHIRLRRIKGGDQQRVNKQRRKGFTKFLSIFQCLRPSCNKDMDRLMELKSFSDATEYNNNNNNKAPHASPLTPAYVRMNRREVAVQQDVEDACRCFENYLMEMIMEEGKTRDLMDVEELLHRWKNLKSPVFIDLVCRFYAELCKDLFSNNNNNY